MVLSNAATCPEQTRMAAPRPSRRVLRPGTSAFEELLLVLRLCRINQKEPRPPNDREGAIQRGLRALVGCRNSACLPDCPGDRTGPRGPSRRTPAKVIARR